MARTRDLKPGFFTDEDVGRVSRGARLLYQALWCHADRKGCVEDRPAWLKTVVFPYDADIGPDEVEGYLQELAADRKYSSGPFIVRYEVGGKRYLCVRNLAKNQRFHPKEKESPIPPPPQGTAAVAASQTEGAPSSGQPQLAAPCCGKPEHAATSRKEQVVSRTGSSVPSVPSVPSGPSGSSAIKRTDSGPSEQQERGEGGERGAGPPPGPAAATDTSPPELCLHPGIDPRRAERLPPGHLLVCLDCGSELPVGGAAPSGPQANPLVNRKKLIAEGHEHLRVTAEILGDDPSQVLARCSTGNGRYKGSPKVRLDTMSDDRLALTVDDLRRERQRAEDLQAARADPALQEGKQSEQEQPDPEARSAWERALQHVASRVNAHAYATWFRPTEGLSLDSQRLQVRVPNGHFAAWLDANYRQVLDEAMAAAGLGDRRLEPVFARPPARAAPQEATP